MSVRDDSGRGRVVCNARSDDPTESKTLRSKYIGEYKSRLRSLRGSNRPFLTESEPVDDSRYLSRYSEWFTRTADDELVERMRSRVVRRGEHWTGFYIREAYDKGLRQARQHLKQAGYDASSVEDATRISRGEHQTKQSILYTKAYTQTEDIAQDARKRATRIVSEYLKNNRDLRDAVGDVNGAISKYSVNSGKRTANTLIVEAVNEALLTSYEIVGVEHVGAAVESTPDSTKTNRIRVNAEDEGQVYFQTSLDANVCKQCRALQGIVISVEAFRNNPATIPPIHPNCRCKLIPLPLDMEERTAKMDDIVTDFPEGIPTSSG